MPIGIPTNFDRLCHSLPVYGQLKLLAAEIAFGVFEESRSAIEIIHERIRNFPDDLLLRLRSELFFIWFNFYFVGLTDRMYGLIIAASISTKHITKWIPIKTIYQGDYRI